MPKKKQQRNGLYWFMQDLLPELRREGRVFPNGMADVVPIALPRWQEMDSLERERYELKARNEKKKNRQATEADKYRLDIKGNVVADRLDKDEEKERRRLKEAKISRSRWPYGDEFLDFKFYLISFEYYWASEDGSSLPVEVGLVEFSLRLGITKTFQKFIKPRTLDGRDMPLGYRFKCKQQSEERHQIPITDFELADKDYYSILLQIENFVNPNGEKHEYPPLYTMDSELENAAFALEWLHHMACVGHAPKIQKIFELENMVLDLYLRTEQPISRASINELFSNSNFDFEESVRCPWHEEVDTRFCALATVNKACFHIADALADFYGYDLTPSHLPKKSDHLDAIITVSAPSPDNWGERMKASRDRSTAWQPAPSRSAYSTFASRDIRYQNDDDDEDFDSDDTLKSDYPPYGADSEDTLQHPYVPHRAAWGSSGMGHNDAEDFDMPARPTLSQAVAFRSAPPSNQKPTLRQAVANKSVSSDSRPSLRQAVAQKEKENMSSSSRASHTSFSSGLGPNQNDEKVFAGGRGVGRGAGVSAGLGRGVGRGVGRGAGRGAGRGVGPAVGRGAGLGRGDLTAPRAVNAPGKVPPPMAVPTVTSGISLRTDLTNAGDPPATFIVPKPEPPPPVTDSKSGLRKPSTMPKAFAMAGQRGQLPGRGQPAVNVTAQPGAPLVGRGRGLPVVQPSINPAPVVGGGRGIFKPPGEGSTTSGLVRPPPGFGRGLSVQMSELSVHKS